MLSPATYQPQNEEEHVDKVQVEFERAENAKLCCRFSILHIHLRRHASNALCIIRSQGGKNEHSCHADDRIQRTAVDEHIHHHRNDQANNAHHQVCTHLR